MKKAVLYIRSTRSRPPAKQRPLVDEYAEENNIEIVHEEVERAGAKGFPAFQRAIDAADGRLIIISNLGQMIKSPRFMELLKQSANFVALGHPNCRPDTLNVLAKAAEELTEATKERIKDSLTKLKKKGVPLGAHRPGATAGPEALRKHAGKGPKAAAKLRSQQAQDYYQDVMPRIIEMRQQGISYDKIAQIFNEEGLTTQTGGPYHEVAVLRLKQRWEKQNKTKMAEQYDKPGRR
jgi:DNA invertase Pin-like site-specific DNA recombinase